MTFDFSVIYCNSDFFNQLLSEMLKAQLYGLFSCHLVNSVSVFRVPTHIENLENNKIHFQARESPGQNERVLEKSQRFLKNSCRIKIEYFSGRYK